MFTKFDELKFYTSTQPSHQVAFRPIRALIPNSVFVREEAISLLARNLKPEYLGNLDVHPAYATGFVLKREEQFNEYRRTEWEIIGYTEDAAPNLYGTDWRDIRLVVDRVRVRHMNLIIDGGVATWHIGRSEEVVFDKVDSTRISTDLCLVSKRASSQLAFGHLLRDIFPTENNLVGISKTRKYQNRHMTPIAVANLLARVGKRINPAYTDDVTPDEILTDFAAHMETNHTYGLVRELRKLMLGGSTTNVLRLGDVYDSGDITFDVSIGPSTYFHPGFVQLTQAMGTSDHLTHVARFMYLFAIEIDSRAYEVGIDRMTGKYVHALSIERLTMLGVELLGCANIQTVLGGIYDDGDDPTEDDPAFMTRLNADLKSLENSIRMEEPFAILFDYVSGVSMTMHYEAGGKRYDYTIPLYALGNFHPSSIHPEGDGDTYVRDMGHLITRLS